MSRYGCYACKTKFDHDPATWSANGIPVTYLFCSEACLIAWRDKPAPAPVEPVYCRTHNRGPLTDACPDCVDDARPTEPGAPAPAAPVRPLTCECGHPSGDHQTLGCYRRDDRGHICRCERFRPDSESPTAKRPSTCANRIGTVTCQLPSGHEGDHRAGAHWWKAEGVPAPVAQRLEGILGLGVTPTRMIPTDLVRDAIQRLAALEAENARLRERAEFHFERGNQLFRGWETTKAERDAALARAMAAEAERDEARHHADVAELDVSALHQQLEAARAALADAQRAIRGMWELHDFLARGDLRSERAMADLLRTHLPPRPASDIQAQQPAPRGGQETETP